MKTRFSLFITAIVLMLFLFSSCSLYNRVFNRNSPERIERQQEKEFEKQHEELKERHMKQQSERTLKMFEQSKKRQKRLNRHKKRSWIKHVLGIGD